MIEKDEFDQLSRISSRQHDLQQAVEFGTCSIRSGLLEFLGDAERRIFLGKPDPWSNPLLTATHKVLDEVYAERLRQDQLFGPNQNYPDGADAGGDQVAMLRAQAKVEAAKRAGTVTWRDLLNEEIAEVRAARTPADLRKELIQAIALMTAQVEDIDRRPAVKVGPP